MALRSMGILRCRLTDQEHSQSDSAAYDAAPTATRSNTVRHLEQGRPTDYALNLGQISRTGDLRREIKVQQIRGAVMATNLVSYIVQFLTPDMIGRIAGVLGLDRNDTQTGVRAAVP